MARREVLLVTLTAALGSYTLHVSGILEAQKAETEAAEADNRRCFAQLEEAQSGPTGVLFRRPPYGGRRT